MNLFFVLVYSVSSSAAKIWSGDVAGTQNYFNRMARHY